MGGELDFRHRMRGGFNNRAATVNDTVSPDKKVNYNGLYNQSGNMPLRPIAGVESIDVALSLAWNYIDDNLKKEWINI